MHVSWAPLPGPQTEAFLNDADILFYGGAAGGGKTDLLLGVSSLLHHRAVIFRRVFPSLRGIIDRSREMFNYENRKASGDTYNEALYRWRFAKGNQLRFGSLQYENDVTAWQGQPHDFHGFDEVTEFTEYQFRYVIGWNRTTLPNQKCRVVSTGNPPTTVDGRWVIRFFAPWLQERYPKPANPGELRWFTTIDKKDIEVDGPEPVKIKGEMLIPKSRTFIQASVYDNPYLINTGYVSQLQALPEPLRTQLLYGNFKIGMEDDPWQLFPTTWVKKAVDRWRETVPPKYIDQLGVDVARGGRDNNVLTPRTGSYFHKQKVIPGKLSEDGSTVANLCITFPGTTRETIFAVDAIGVGASPVDMMRQQKMQVRPLIASERSEARDKSDKLGFKNQRAEWYWRFRELLDPDNHYEPAIPDDSELIEELFSITFEVRTAKIVVEDKEEVKKRIGRSPDKMDSLIYSSAEPAQLGMGLFDYMKNQYEQKQAKQTKGEA